MTDSNSCVWIDKAALSESRLSGCILSLFFWSALLICFFFPDSVASSFSMRPIIVVCLSICFLPTLPGFHKEGIENIMHVPRYWLCVWSLLTPKMKYHHSLLIGIQLISVVFLHFNDVILRWDALFKCKRSHQLETWSSTRWVSIISPSLSYLSLSGNFFNLL